MQDCCGGGECCRRLLLERAPAVLTLCCLFPQAVRVFRKSVDLCSVDSAALRQDASEPRQKSSLGLAGGSAIAPLLLPDEDPIYRSKIHICVSTFGHRPICPAGCGPYTSSQTWGTGSGRLLLCGKWRKPGTPVAYTTHVEPSPCGHHLHAVHPV